MNQTNPNKNILIKNVEKKLHSNHNRIKTIRAITYVSDIFIILIAVLLIFDINFSQLLLFPTLISLVFHTILSFLYEKKCTLKQEEAILKHKKQA